MHEALRNRCVLKGGTGFPERFQGDRGGEVPFIKVSDMNSLGNERYITVANNYVSAKTATMLNATIFPAGSIVFAKVGAALLLNRRRVLSAPTIIDNNMMAAIPISGDFDFLYHFLCSCDFSSLVQSGALPSVNQKQIGEIQIPIFAESTQRKIATILSTIDTAIEQTEALIEKYQHIKAGLMHDLFTRGVLPNGQLRPPREQAPELYQETAIGWIPKEWDLKLIREVCFEVGDGVHYSVTRSNEGVPFLFVSCVRNGRIDWDSAARISPKTYLEISKKSKPCEGMILLTVVGSYGHVAHVSSDDAFGFERNIAYLKSNTDTINSKYLYNWLSSDSVASQIERLVIGNAQKVLTLGNIGKIALAVPKIHEQLMTNEKLAAVESRVHNEQELLSKLQRQKLGLMQDLLTGKVAVTVDTPAIEVTA